MDWTVFRSFGITHHLSPETDLGLFWLSARMELSEAWLVFCRYLHS